jgi:hypothetical protein
MVACFVGVVLAGLMTSCGTADGSRSTMASVETTEPGIASVDATEPGPRLSDAEVREALVILAEQHGGRDGLPNLTQVTRSEQGDSLLIGVEAGDFQRLGEQRLRRMVLRLTGLPSVIEVQRRQVFACCSDSEAP